MTDKICNNMWSIRHSASRIEHLRGLIGALNGDSLKRAMTRVLDWENRSELSTEIRDTVRAALINAFEEMIRSDAKSIGELANESLAMNEDGYAIAPIQSLVSTEPLAVPNDADGQTPAGLVGENLGTVA